MNKIVSSTREAVADIFDGATVMIGGFGGAGRPQRLIEALLEQGARDLTCIANAPMNFETLVENRRVKKAVVTFPVWPSPLRPNPFEDQYEAGEIELELVPQGTMAERIRAAGAGMAAFYTPTGMGTEVAPGKEVRTFGGKEYLMELALKADFALIGAYRADRLGNLVYRMASRNFNPLMAMAATVTIAEVQEIVEVGQLDPEHIVTPGIFVDRVVKTEKEVTWHYPELRDRR